jgi:3-hydroxybutyryl-CoA dehydratase
MPLGRLPSIAMDVHEGQTRSYERTFSEDDIQRFAELSGDTGQQHVERDAEGRLMAQGLLTATLPTKLGGDIDYIAHTLEFEFVRPVFAGDAITCESEIRSLTETDDRTLMESAFVCHNGDGEVVMRGESEGMIPA